MFSPMPTCTASSGPSSAPATAQSAAPMPKTSVKRRGMSVPMAVAISRFDAPARTSAPIRVFCTSSQSSERERQADAEDQQPVRRVLQAGQQLDRAGERRRRRQRQVVAEDHLDAVVEDQDQREGREHLREVVARIERAQQAGLERHAEDGGERDRADDAEQERAGERRPARRRGRRRPCRASRARG